MYIQKYYKVIRVIKDGDGGATPLYIENVSDSDGKFQLTKNGSPTYTPNLIYRIGDNGEWFEYDMTTLPSITVPSGSKIYFRGDNVNGFNQNNNTYIFRFTKDFNIGGYLTSLLVLDNFNTITDIPRYSFSNLFNRQSYLLNTKDLITDNIINVGARGFAHCFQYCTSLTTAPNFNNVTSVGDNGFYSCFDGCTSLITAPNFSNVTTVDYYGFDSCFDGCTSLTTAPNFNNVTTVGVRGFQSCFNGCTSLTTAPNFNNVTSVGDNGFISCFYGCTSLQVVYAPNVTTWDESKFDNWLYNISPTGIMYKPANLSIPTGTNGVPEGWTTENY